ncbi:serine aminopeptidase domain-containing protein [Streptomyces sp. NPDC059698]|uniref:serine aminopeptidase domain-containing protein n=1 Tax=unclassified Streptomyces TaxID=2593676 RepID=UPI00093BC86B|nr:alpha/beta family hydrolase [Streptomyces sp. CB02366]OKJ38561.1 esterase [Streptomyces sp. CB02366]TVP35356.1 esterase [Streptomyces griseus subsp. griseus]WSS56635.1 lysophospholipase [Streptomyces sp. NBC_01178]
MVQRPPSAAVLVLHGGRETGTEPPPPGLLNLPGARMRPFVRALGRAARAVGEDVLVREVRYGHRGWNGARADPFHDAVAALDALREQAGDELPVVLLGHSMGARAALRAAGHPLVRGVVGLAPWCPPGDPVTQLAGRDVVLVHSTRDRLTSPQASQSLTARARRAGARTCMITVRGGDHAMIRRAPAWHRVTTALVMGLLGSGSLPGPVGTALALPATAEATEGTLDLDLDLGPGDGPGPGPSRNRTDLAR